MSDLRCLTVRQPWAWAIVHGGKDVENRTRNIAGAYRGPVAIHAGLAKFEQHNMASRALRAAHGTEVDVRVLYGCVVGVVELVDVHDEDECLDREIRRLDRMRRATPEEFAALPDNGAGGLIGRIHPCSPWSIPDEFHLVLANPRPLARPIPTKGRLGLWRPDEALATAIREQVAL